MKNKEKNTKYVYNGFLIQGLFLLFTGLKLGGVINWSWWWITAPLWIPVSIGLSLIIIIGIIKWVE
jgi:hypothetical protein